MPKVSVVSDRLADLKEALSARDLTPEMFVDLALQESDVDRVDIFKYFGGGFTPSKVGDLRSGFDALQTSQHIEEKFGSGRYRLSTVAKGIYHCHKTYAFGIVMETPVLLPSPSARDRDGESASDVANRVAKDLSNTLRTTALLGQTRDVIADAETRAIEREVKPAQMMMGMMGTMMDVVKGLGKTGPDPMVPLIIQMMQSQQTMFLTLIENSQQERANPASGVAGITETLATLERTLTGRIGELLGERTEPKSTDWVTVASVAAPLLERTLGVIEAAVTGRRASAAPAPSTEIAVSTRGESMKLHPDPDVDQALHEAGALGVQMLISRDYKSFAALFELNFPDFLEKIDPETNGIIYVQWLKRVDPAYGPLVQEFKGFMEYLEANAEEDDPPSP